MTIQRKDIADARVVPANNAKNDGRAPNDAAISNSRLGPERSLKAWVPDAGYEVDGSLEKPSAGGAWDQFAENERLFGLKTDYDENIYTTAIDKSHPQYKERLAAAERKAREIERTLPTTSHVAEERVMDFVGGEDQRDEEDKYSGVRRQDFPPLATRDNKYTPPARRAPTGQATVKGVPVDPAIISSQLKSTPTPKPTQTPKTTEPKSQVAAEKPATPVSDKPAESKAGAAAGAAAATGKAPESKAETTSDAKAADAKDGTAARPAATTSRGASKVGPVPGATANVERDVLSSFRNFATTQRFMAEKVRTTRAKADKEVKLTELKKFAENFKLFTPVPKDLISIIAKDPAKQKQIQDKAKHNMDELAKQKEVATQDKEMTTSKDTQGKASAEQSGASTPAATADAARGSSRPAAPQHSGSAGGVPGRHQGNRSSYNPQPHYQYNRNNRPPPHMAPQSQTTGNLAQRLRNVEQQKMQHPHMGQHPPPDMRLPPTGPANSVDPGFNRRMNAAPPPFMGPKLNPNSHEFRPNAFAQPFNPAVPSSGSSPRSSVNNIAEAAVPPVPIKGQLIRRKTRAVDVKKCFILSHIETIQPPQGRNWDDNDGLKPSFDTLPTWRQLQEETEAPDSTMHLTYKQYFERLPLSNTAVATPNPTHAMPQMHAGQHGPAPHVPFSNPDDHRMMHSNSAQSFASPRMGPVPMAYPPTVNPQGQMPYGQPVMQPYMNGLRWGFMGPNGMVTAGPMYPGAQPHFIPAGAGPPQPVPGSNGFPSPGRPTAPMMVHQGSHQGSHQGQQAVYGMSPGMPYQQPAYTPQQPQGKFSGQRPQ
ncbi:hypothetical protein CHGG_10460 [Chaetomium globosum CBS 148.51]|uniref:LsmAD domain-containing protein n=1 Tax=Chaetomium globosum (strain ATCC 6205 / CBS 148.51 / DSM 1962 / NBRC 6347 / NRRL 1970) TaxID=306901 RepID=Q2GNJ4_CHAGB|nr:uncharacterized protein CHGG_10460 [Chaetomium globosum CBS 148.51]EAQ84056.1 hypothetical protein CHGG_10460 [Chaetomium globosum CBS 148.51]